MIDKSTIPSGWSYDRLDQFFELQRGFDLTESAANAGTIPVISSSGISYYHNVPKVQPPGVVTGRKGRLGLVFYIEQPFWPHDTTLWVKDFKGNDPKFIRVFLESLQLKTFDAATSVPTLNRNNLHPLRVAFPPLAEQRKIAAILSTWDEAITLTSQLIAALQRRKQALMQLLLTGAVRFPEFMGSEWDEVELGEIAEVIMGQSPPSEYYNSDCNGLPLIQGNADITNRQTAPRTYTAVITKICEIGDTILSVRAPVGETARSLHQACIGRGVAAIRATVSNPEFLYQEMLFSEQKWQTFAQGSTFTAINSTDIRAFELQVPASLEEQSRIAEVLNLSDGEIERLSTMQARLSIQKRGLMQQLLTGVVRVQVDKNE